MNFWQRIFSRKANAQTMTAISALGQPKLTPAKYDKLADEGFNKNVVAYRAISYIASAIGQLDWDVYKKARAGKPIEVDDPLNPLVALLDRPNPGQGAAAFFEAIAAYYLLSGNSYLLSNGPGSGAPTEIWPLRPDYMKVIPGQYRMPAAFQYKEGNNPEIIYPVDQMTGASSVLQIKSFNPTNAWYGLSCIQVAALAIDQHNESGKWNVSMLQNNATPSGAIVVDVSPTNPSGTLQEQQFDRLKQMVEERYTGAANARRPMLLEGGLKWQQFSLSPQDMDFIEGKHVSAREIALGIGVPPMLLGIPGDNTYSNYQEARLAVYEERILPLADMIANELTRFLAPAFGDQLFIKIDKDEIDALEPKRQAKWDKVGKANWLSINEKREATGYEPDAFGEVILVPNNLVSLEVAVESDPNSGIDAGNADAMDPQAGNGQAQADQSQPANEEDDNSNEDDAGKSELANLETKVLNLPNKREKQAEWKRQDRLRRSYEKRLSNQLGALFQIQGEHVKAALKNRDVSHAPQAIDRAMEEQRPQLRAALQSAAYKTGLHFGSRVLNALKSGHGPSELKASDNVFRDKLQYWIDGQMGDKITGIEATTKERVLNAIKRAVTAPTEVDEEGQQQTVMQDGAQATADAIQSAVDDEYGAMSDGRAMMIARTETVAASNFASVEAAKTSGVDNLQKEWISSPYDSRAREEHHTPDVDGQRVGVDENFIVAGEELQFPGDPNGSPENVINCRCTTAFVSADEE